MSDLIRTDTVFGKRVNVVGNISADLVLESLGKIYIKSRNKALTLEEVITSLVTTDPNVSTSRTKVVQGIEGLDTTEFKEGTFVFDKLSNILYLYIDEELLELINVAPEGTGYVKRSGDTMTGRLAIYVKNGPPLYVNSSKLVENLNALYLNGETAEQFTRRNANEKINGRWTFRSPTTFDSNTLFYKDIVTHGSVGSSNFASGFGGYGWRMDADTNTLTVDNLVVRKLMQVYELVVNRISATNGSLWVTNAGKVVKALKLPIKEASFFAATDEYGDFAAGMLYGEAFIKLDRNLSSNATLTILAENLLTPSGNGIQDKVCWKEETLRAANVIIISSPGIDLSSEYFNNSSSKDYHIFPLFSSDFKIDCTFPIITRNLYKTYKDAEALIEDLERQLSTMSTEDTNYLQYKSSLEAAKTAHNPYLYLGFVKSYFKYFANGDYYLVSFDDDSLPIFKPGDIVRCQKWTDGGIKYYDGVICNLIRNSYVIQLALSILDKKTIISYDSSLEPLYTVLDDEVNLTLYLSSKKTSKYNSDYEGTEEELMTHNLIGLILEGDSIVLMGNLWDRQRQNAVYITSVDNGAPYMDVLSGVNRPDFSVIYYTPIFKTIKLVASESKFVPMIYPVNLDEVHNIAYTGDYYVQRDGVQSCDYTYIKVVKTENSQNTTDYFLIDGYKPVINGVGSGGVSNTAQILYYLNLNPNSGTALTSATENVYILLEAVHENNTDVLLKDSRLLLDGGNGYILLDNLIPMLQVSSTRTTKARFGNLDGIQDETFPIDRLPYGYGLYGQNVFLTGEFYLNNGLAVADIGKEAISFAVASLNATSESIRILERDLRSADELLKNSVYSKGDLLSAGMRIGNDREGKPGIVMWGNKIIIATTANELLGIDAPTALFTNGRIIGKFILVADIHSSYGNGEILVTQRQEGTSNIYYELELELDSNGWYYIDSGTKVYPSNHYNGFSTYGWHLKAHGEGYLANGNIEWDSSGALTVRGSLELDTADNALSVKTNGNEVFKISNKSLIYNNNATILNVVEDSSYSQTVTGTIGGIDCLDTSGQTSVISLSKDIVPNVGDTLYIKFEVISLTEEQCTGSLSWALETYHDKITIDFGDFDLTINYSPNRTYNIETLICRVILLSISSITIRWPGHKILSLLFKLTIKQLDFKAEIGSNFFNIISNNNVYTIGPKYLSLLNTNGGLHGIVISDDNTLLLYPTEVIRENNSINLYDKLEELESRIYTLEQAAT